LKHSEPPEALCRRGRRDLESQIKAAVGRLAELRNCKTEMTPYVTVVESRRRGACRLLLVRRHTFLCL